VAFAVPIKHASGFGIDIDRFSLCKHSVSLSIYILS
jgi:hypothetical protein